MDCPYNETHFQRDYFYTKLRDKYKTEIRKSQNINLFKLKRLAFQVLPQSSLDDNKSKENSDINEKNNIFEKNANFLEPNETFEKSAEKLNKNENLDEIKKKINETMQDLTEITKDQAKILENLVFLRKLSSNQPANNNSIMLLLESGFFAILLEFMRNFSSFNFEIQDELLWLACNLTYLESIEFHITNKYELVVPLKKCLLSKIYKQGELALWTLNNLADDDNESRDLIIKEEILEFMRDKIIGGGLINLDVLKNFLILMHALSKAEDSRFFEQVLNI